MRKQALQIPRSNDVCIFCLASIQFASVSAVKPSQPRFLSSTATLHTPPNTEVALKEEDGASDPDSVWRKPPPRPFGGGWAKARTAVPMDLTPEEKALKNALQKDIVRKTPVSATASRQDGRDQIAQGLRPQKSPLPVPDSHESHTAVAKEPPVPEPMIGQNGQDGTSHGIISHRSKVIPHEPNHDGEKRLPGLWFCPSCKENRLSTRQICFKCQTKRPSMNFWTCEKCGSEHPSYHRFCSNCARRDSTEVAKFWKHVRRRASHDETTRQIGDDVDLKSSQPEQTSSQKPSGDPRKVHSDTEAIAKARAIEQEKTERMDRTKGGEFVGLRNQYETATSEAMKDSYWSLETDKSQVPDVVPKTSSTPETPSAGSNLVHWRAQVRENPQVNEGQDIRGQRSSQEMENADYSRTAKLTGGWKQWKPSPAVRQPFLEEPLHALPHETDRSTHPSSTSLKHEQNATGYELPIRQIESRTSSRPPEQLVAKQIVGEHTVSSRRNRHKMRKEKMVSTYDDLFDEDEDHNARRMERKELRKKAKAAKKAAASPTPIYLPEYISVSNLAGVLRVRIEEFIGKMNDLGFEETNHDLILDAETAGLVATEFNFEPIFEQAGTPDLLPRPPAEDKSVLPPRPPVVTIMGHVDHGKTTLLDYLRKSSVAASEHGGITQHIGAFSVSMPGGRLVTFLDTPGHEAFLSMRQRGANVTDIVILVVAADDSVKPQTIEAIKHAQSARVPMIVAINKIDKGDSNPERVKQDLARYSVEVEDYGGDTQAVCVSGKTGQGMEELEDAAVALADILDMRSETDGQAEGWVLEATTKKAGRVATVLVRRGTLRPGDIIVAGTSWARVRSLRNEAGTMLKSAGPGTPVEIDGWREQPAAGDEVIQASDEQKAKAVVDYRLEASARTQMATDMAAVNEVRRQEQEKRAELERAAELAEQGPDAATTSAEGQSTPSTPSFQEVFFIVKADVSGSVEAVTEAVSALGNSEVRPHILRTGVGPITEFDVDHAAVAKGHILSFNTTVDGSIQRMAEAKEVRILDQSIIYRLVDDVKATLSEKLPPIVTQKVLGEAEIAQVFEINTKGRVTVPIAGCKIRNGIVSRKSKTRVLRGKETIYVGTLSSLKNVKKDVNEMRKGTECGMGFEDWTAFKPGDQVQCYEETFEKRTL